MLANHFHDQIAAVIAVEDSLAIAVDALALFVHHLVVFEQILANLEVPLFDLFLRTLDPAGDHPAFDRFAFLHAQPRENVLHPFAGKNPHQIVFQRQEEATAARITLPTAATA